MYEWPSQKWRVFVVASLIVVVSQCRRVHPHPSSYIDISNLGAANQLVAGFHNLEGGKWRWTAGTFIVSVAPPPGADRKGARLLLQFYIPDAQIKSLGPMTLFASVENHFLTPETYNKGGVYYYTRTVPPADLQSNLVSILFRFDKAAPPTATDGRELAAVVSSIGLQANQ